ncbi:auxiliary component of ABC transporter, partial [mine drainage metagenome]
MVPAPDPAVLGLGRAELSHDDVITAGLRSINVSTIGSFEQTEHARLRLVPLLQSSGDAGSASVQRVLDTPDPQALLDNLRQARGRYVLAARLTGALAPGAQQADIVLVADTDLLSDRLWVQLLPFFGQTLTSPFANNGDFFLNVVDNLSGSSALISIRGRAVAARPFTRLRALRAEAEQAFRERRLALQQQLDAAEQRLLEIEQARRAAGASISLHEAEYRAASEQQREIRNELRHIERDLDARILRLQW